MRCFGLEITSTTQAPVPSLYKQPALLSASSITCSFRPMEFVLQCTRLNPGKRGKEQQTAFNFQPSNLSNLPRPQNRKKDLKSTVIGSLAFSSSCSKSGVGIPTYHRIRDLQFFQYLAERTRPLVWLVWYLSKRWNMFAQTINYRNFKGLLEALKNHVTCGWGSTTPPFCAWYSASQGDRLSVARKQSSKSWRFSVAERDFMRQMHGKLAQIASHSWCMA